MTGPKDTQDDITISTVSSSNSSEYIDGRSLRRTGRTVQFSTKVLPSFKTNLAKAASLTGKNYNQILEESLISYLDNIASEKAGSKY